MSKLDQVHKSNGMDYDEWQRMRKLGAAFNGIKMHKPAEEIDMMAGISGDISELIPQYLFEEIEEKINKEREYDE